MIRVHEIALAVGNAPLEDAIGAHDSLAWVIDGATSLAATRAAPDAESDGTWLVARLEEELRKRSSSLAPVTDLLAECIVALRGHAEREWVAEPEIPPSAAVAVSAIRGDGSLEYAVLADCSFVTRVDGEPFVVTDDRADDGNTAAMEMLSGLVGNIPFTEAIHQIRPLLLERRRAAMNRDIPDGYWVVALDEHAVEHALTGTIELAPEQPWWLLSDGLSRCVDLFRQLNWEEFTTGRGLDLDRLLRELIEFEHGDPEAVRFPRWNIADDKAGGRFTWSPDA
jgi:hypothetical protein